MLISMFLKNNQVSPLPNDNGFNLEVRRTNRRKTISIQVIDGTVRVLAPHRVLDADIATLLEEKSTWITRKLQDQAANKPATTRSYISGERWPFLGNEFVLDIRVGRAVDPICEDGRLMIWVPSSRDGKPHEAATRHQLELWLRSEAQRYFTQHTNSHAERLGCVPKSITFKTYKARWGSCSASGKITYDWRLVMAPLEIIDYVAAHEVAHLRHLNHSRDFWDCVEWLCPDYKDRRNWLRKYGAGLTV